MKKSIKLILALAVLITFSIPVIANASKRVSYSRSPMQTSTGAQMDALSVASTTYSQSFNVEQNVGFSSLLVIEDKSGGAGDVDISAEYSLDDSNWYTANTSDMSGTLTEEGNIVTQLGNESKWIVFTPRLSKYMRLKFDPDAASQVTAYFIMQTEER